MKLPTPWEDFFKQSIDLKDFYVRLNRFVEQYTYILPAKEKIFAVFEYINPADVTCVLFGEDPYPRRASACGIAFWDKEINSWEERTNGNSLKNILKALITADGRADYTTKIDEIRKIALHMDFKSPPQLFEHWLGQGILLVNTSLTFTSPKTKKEHFEFWQPFHQILIRSLNVSIKSPFYILWGGKAARWEEEILKSIDDPKKIIKQGHPTFIHQFMDKQQPRFSPFSEIVAKTGLSWY